MKLTLLGISIIILEVILFWKFETLFFMFLFFLLSIVLGLSFIIAILMILLDEW